MDIVVEIVAPDGKEAILSFDSTATFGSIEDSIQAAFQIPASEQKLIQIHRGAPLIFGATAPLYEVFGAS